MSADRPPPSDENRRLESWKEIADYFGRTIRTVQRWDRDESLPVHRKQHKKRASVFAYTNELEAWWNGRSADLSEPIEELEDQIAEPVPVSPEKRSWAGLRFVRLLSAVAGILIAAW